MKGVNCELINKGDVGVAVKDAVGKGVLLRMRLVPAVGEDTNMSSVVAVGDKASVSSSTRAMTEGVLPIRGVALSSSFPSSNPPGVIVV